MIGIIDYNINNIGSVLNAVKYLNIKHEVVHEPESLSSYQMLILPGVGSFDSGVRALRSTGMFDGLKNLDLKSTKLFGICLGMQLLSSSSEEGTEQGLGLIEAKVKHLKNINCSGKIPHVGFNTVQSSDDHQFLNPMVGNDFYFVHSHSYAVDACCDSVQVAICHYEGASIVAAFRAENIFGTQFHPEKSGVKGLNLLRQAYEC